MKYYQYLILFLFINLGSLVIGTLLMENGPRTSWYLNLNKAPWTPPGWVFGAAWTFIMVLFSIYLTNLFRNNKNNNKIKIAFSAQLILNISWNYIFFNQHLILPGLIVLIFLNIVLCYFFFNLSNGKSKYLLIPYMVWMCIATSLNLYILIHN